MSRSSEKASGDRSSLISRIARGTKASFVGQVLYMASNGVLIILLTRIFLTPEEFGRLYFALSVVGAIALFASLGIPKSSGRYVTEYVEKDPTQVRYILRKSLVYISVLSGSVSVVLALASAPLARLLGEPGIAPLLFVGAGYVVARALNGYLSILFQGFNRVTWSAAMTALSGIGRLVLAVAFVVAGLGALGALLGYVAGYVLAVAVGAVVLYRRFYTRFGETDRPESGLARRLLRYSIPLTATKGAGALDNRVDTILVGILLNPVAVGYYVIAKQIHDVLTVPAGSFGFTLSPAIGEQKAGDRMERAATLYEESLRHVLLFYIPAAVGLILVANPVVKFLFGAEYLDAVPVLQVFSGILVVRAINKITSDGLDYLGRASSRAVAKGVMAVSNVALNLVLIPSVGVVGAAVATLVTYTFYTLTNVYIIHQELSLRIGRLIRGVGVICAITLGMIGPVVLVLPFVSGIVSLVTVVLFGGAVWMVLSVLSGFLDVHRLKSLLL